MIAYNEDQKNQFPDIGNDSFVFIQFTLFKEIENNLVSETSKAFFMLSQH
jgi:hypothetical protein